MRLCMVLLLYPRYGVMRYETENRISIPQTLIYTRKELIGY